MAKKRDELTIKSQEESGPKATQRPKGDELLSSDSHVAGIGASINQQDANTMESIGDSAIGKEGKESPADIDIDAGYDFSEKNPVPGRQSSQDRASNARDVTRRGGKESDLNRR